MGVFRQDGNANVEIYEGLLMLQHRGQDSAGMVCTDWYKFREKKDNGLVKDVFSKKETLEKLTGMCCRCICDACTRVCMVEFGAPSHTRYIIYPPKTTAAHPYLFLHTGHVGIGHVRYPTAGSASAQEAQPFFVNSPLGIYLIHNGNLTNTTQLRDMLQSSHSFFNRHMRTTSDSEVLLNVLADEVHRAHQNCLNVGGDPNSKKAELVFQVGR